VAVLVLAAAVAVVVVLATSGGSARTPAVANRARVASMLRGIPQSGYTLGNPNAPVTVTEYGDLICPACGRFALGSEAQLISSEVRAGKVKLVYRGFMSGETANAAQYAAAQVAARAAGLQDRAWYYVLLFYAAQRNPAVPYVTTAYLQRVASEVPGLDFAKWKKDLKDRSLDYAIVADGQKAIADDVIQTPTIIVKGSSGSARFRDPKTSVPSIAQLRGLIARVK